MRLFEKREAYAAVKVRGSGVTKPTAMADLVYNGQEQYLVTMEYRSADNETGRNLVR